MRIWLGTFSLSRKRGRNWNIGVHVYEDEKIGHQAVIKTIRKALKTDYPNAEIVISPAAKNALGE